MDRAPIYLDYNATTPLAPEVADAMLPFLYDGFGNPSSGHAYGRRAREAVEEARGEVAGLIGAEPSEIVFTSGGTESNNTVVRGLFRAAGRRGRVITSAVEHPAVLEPCRAVEADGGSVTVLPVSGQGRVDPAAVEAALTDDAILVSVMHANNEVGTLQPLEEIARVVGARGVPLHTDAAQSVGKVPVDVDALGVDFLTIAGHKLYAPKGVGALYVRDGRSLPRWMHGADHEDGRRAGTENVLEIVGLGRAATLAREHLVARVAHARALRDRLWEALRARLPGIVRHGDPRACLPNTLSVALPGLDAGAVLALIADRVAASAGAACHAEGVSVSSVLEAMDVPTEVARGTIRLSVGLFSTPGEMDEAAEALAGAAAALAS